MKLLTFTKKDTTDLVSFVPKPHLLFHPFGVVKSRLNHKTEVFNTVKQAESIAEILQNRSKPSNWDECCAQRAEEILALKKDHYFLAYSGGIDSTAMVVSFLKVWSPMDLKKITILLTHHSVEENPSFFDNHIVQFKMKNYLTDISKILLKSNSLMIMAELGDQLFGSDLFFAAKQNIDQQIRRDYKIAVPEIIELHTKTPGTGKLIFEHFHPIADECPFPIKTAHDFFWWLNFTQKWQYVKFRFPECTTWDLRARYGSHVLNFYDSMAFQKWSIQNHDLKIKETWDSYKFLVKEYIYKYTKDRSQLNLVKIPSLEKTYVLSEKRIAITQDYGVVNSLGDLQNYVRTDF